MYNLSSSSSPPPPPQPQPRLLALSCLIITIQASLQWSSWVSILLLFSRQKLCSETSVITGASLYGLHSVASVLSARNRVQQVKTSLVVRIEEGVWGRTAPKLVLPKLSMCRR